MAYQYYVDNTTGDIKYETGAGQVITVARNSRNSYKREFVLVSGTQVVQIENYTRIGGGLIDPSDFSSVSQITFEVFVTSSAPTISADIRLFNVSDNSIVSGTTSSSFSTTGTTVTSTITLPSSSKNYEVQLKISSATGNNAVSCSRAVVTIYKNEIGF